MPQHTQSDPLALHRAPWRRAAALYRVRLRPRWREIRPIVLIGLFLGVLVLGTIGFYDWARPPFDSVANGRPDYSIFDAFYRSLLLFGLGGAVDPPVPTTLQIARIVAPLSSATAGATPTARRTPSASSTRCSSAGTTSTRSSARRTASRCARCRRCSPAWASSCTG